MRKRDEITVGDTKVKSLRSTDEGVAFLVKCEDRIDLSCRGSELVALGRGR